MRFLVLISIFISGIVFGQEGVEPIAGNPDLYHKIAHKKRANSGTFDSTFIYTTDTITLPLFDDFSKDKFQKYNAQPTDPGVTSDKKYRLLDAVTGLPVHNDSLYTTQQTTRRIYNVDTDTYVDQILTPRSVKLGDLSSYPVVYATTDVYPPYFIYDTIGVPDVSDTLWIIGPDIYQDSATQFFQTVTDPNLIWLDDNAYLNDRFAVNPWSIGVVTFDGLDRTGFPYAIGTQLTNYADYLTSKPMDLSSLSPADSVYLSFLFQREGFGDKPESSDSLVVEFYNPDTDVWYRQWSTSGGPVAEFELAHMVLNDPNFFKDGFQLRFKNYGGLSGSLDHFHIDYVHLRSFSGYQDTLIEDFALSYSIPTLLKDYTSVPWDHFKNNPLGKTTDAFPIVVRNSYLNGGSNISSAAGGKVEIKYNNVVEGTIGLNGQLLANYNPPAQPIPDYQPRTTYESVHDGTSFNYDNSKLGEIQEFDIVASVSVPVGSNFLQNDTAYSVQKFSNYYSYDDGTAEQAYGPQGQQGIQARLAIQYTAYEADSVIGLQIHFVPTVNDVSNKLFRIVIWNDNNGKPGNVIYEDDALFARTPEYEIVRNKFVTYYLLDTMKVPVDGTFYVGWIQIDQDRLGVGLDKNIDNKQHTFYSLDDETTWTTSTIDGSVMIHPVFSTSLDSQLGIMEKPKMEKEVLIYPNPSTGQFNVKVRNEEVTELWVYSIMGQMVLHTTESSFDLSEMNNGVYFVKIANDPSRTFKVIKK